MIENDVHFDRRFVDCFDHLWLIWARTCLVLSWRHETECPQITLLIDRLQNFAWGDLLSLAIGTVQEALDLAASLRLLLEYSAAHLATRWLCPAVALKSL